MSANSGSCLFARDQTFRVYSSPSAATGLRLAGTRVRDVGFLPVNHPAWGRSLWLRLDRTLA